MTNHGKKMDPVPRGAPPWDTRDMEEKGFAATASTLPFKRPETGIITLEIVNKQKQTTSISFVLSLYTNHKESLSLEAAATPLETAAAAAAAAREDSPVVLSPAVWEAALIAVALAAAAAPAAAIVLDFLLLLWSS